ncbi:MAG TPA: immunity 22 family protein [Verrucomicrobiae bacterium]|nr:immunity 22 family protein [Verrucomicrobiae bacterium]
MLKHDEFRKGGRVSVWIGNFASDIELDDYLNIQRTFEKDFDFEINERDMPESKVEEEAVPIAKLVEGFSWADSYAGAVARLAEERGVNQATTMVIFINFEYNSERVKCNPDSLLKFLGVVSFGVQ